MSVTADSPVPNTVIVVGSANVDQVFRVARIPTPGETVMSAGLWSARGGKGQNQAVAAARAGASTTFIAAVGGDEFGRRTLVGLTDDDVDVSLVRTVDAPTGTALIAVDDGGENTIIVDAGANAELTALTSSDEDVIRAASILVMQLEIPLQTVVAAARIARAGGTTVILNAAPIKDLPAELLADVDILVVNEHEAASLAGSDDVSTLARTVIVTLGAAGAVMYEQGSTEIRVQAPTVKAIDATGAGDTFCGALAAALAAGSDLETALRFAVTAASLSVQHAGAVPSIPRRVDIIDALLTGNEQPQGA